MCETLFTKFLNKSNLSWEFENEHALWNWLLPMSIILYGYWLLIYKQQETHVMQKKIYHGNLNYIVYEIDCWALLIEIDYSIVRVNYPTKK